MYEITDFHILKLKTRFLPICRRENAQKILILKSLFM